MSDLEAAIERLEAAIHWREIDRVGSQANDPQGYVDLRLVLDAARRQSQGSAKFDQIPVTAEEVADVIGHVESAAGARNTARELLAKFIITRKLTETEEER